MAISPEERRAIAQQDAYFLLMPLQLGSEPHSIAAHARKMVRLLRDSSAPSPSAAAISHLVKLYDRSVSAHPAIACKKGCGYCCSQSVSLSAPEAFFVADQIRGRDDTKAAVAQAASRIAALAPDRLWADWPRCPLLAEEACSIYAARPLGCHGFVSVNLPSCISAFVDRGQPDIPMPLDHTRVLQGCRMLLHVAQRLIGAHAKAYEMNRAVTAILAMENAEARWLGGEDVLAGLEDTTPIPPDVEREILALADFVRPTL